MPLDGGPVGMAAKIAMSYKDGKGGQNSGAGEEGGGASGPKGMDCKEMQAVAERNKAAIRAAGGRI